MWWIVAAASAATQVDSTLDAPGEPTVTVSAPCGTVRVVGSDRATVHVVGTVGDGQAFETAFASGRVKVDVDETGGCPDLTIEVPAVASLELQGVATSFTVDGLRGGVDAETISGSIRVTGGVRRLELESVSGTVFAEGASGTVTMETVSGSIELVRASALTHVELTTVSGGITFDGALAAAGRLEASTHSGILRVRLPAATDARLSQTTFSGRIHNAFGTEGDFVLGAGTGRIELSTFSGDVEVERR